MAINLPGGFSILNVDPIDARFVVADQSERLGFSSANVYEGLLVYQEDNNKLYVLTDTSNYNQTSGWTEVINEGADLSALNTFSGSIQSQVDSLTALTSSYLTELPLSVISSSAQISALGYLTSQTDSQTLTIAGNTLSISNGNSVILPTGGGSSIWTTGSQDPVVYTHLMTSNNLQVTGSFEVLGDLTVNGKSIFTQVSASDTESAVQIKGRLELVEHQIDNYIASASIKIGNTKDVIDCGGFF
jgi:hypothetical protein